MATSKYIRGLSGAGFRVPTNGSATALQRVTENRNASNFNYQVDLDHDKTQKILVGEKDNFIRVPAQASQTTTIIGLTRYGFRIRNSAGVLVKVKLGSGVHTIDLTSGRALKVLRRSYGRYLFATDAHNVAIRGIVAQQTGFDIKSVVAGSYTVTLTDGNATNVNNADSVVVGAKTYTFKTNLTEAKATATLTSDATIPTAADTVTIGAVTYTFRAAPTTVANEVKLGASAAASLTNLKAAINQTGVSGTDYGSATVIHPTVTAGTLTATTLVLTAKTVGVAGNALASTETSTHLSFAGATFAGGVAAIANEVKIGGSADASLTNLSEAINAGANVGTDYATGTTANADATASAVTAHAITLTAVAGGSASITVSESTTGARLTASDSTLTDNLVKVYAGVTATVDPQDPNVYTQLRRHFKSYVEA